MSKPPPDDGAAAASVRDSRLISSLAGAGFGTSFGFGGSNGEPCRSMAEVKVLTAFSIIGSTYLRIPNLLSKS